MKLFVRSINKKNNFYFFCPKKRQTMANYFEVQGQPAHTPHWSSWANLCINCSTLFIVVGAAIAAAPLLNDANVLIHDAQSMLGDFNEIIPEVSETLRIVGSLCEYENFTRTGWSFICD